MTIVGWVQIALFSVIVILITRPFGGYLTRVFNGERTFLSPVLRPIERTVYWCCGVDEKEEQHWLTYAVAMLFFSVVGFVTLYALQRLQWYLPFNPQGQAGVEQVLAFNTGVSFVTNTNWQSYVPETTMGYLVQMAGLTVHNFVSAAVGVAIALALIRGFARREAEGIGNFWVDVTRIALYVLLPVSIVTSLVFVFEGVPQNLSAYVDAATLEGMKQTIAQGPVASQEVIKVLGTNGGGFFNANSAHPYENPTALTNLMQMLLLIGIAAGLTNVLGRMVRDQRQGWAIFGAMAVLLLLGIVTVYWAEALGNPAFAPYHVDVAPNALQAGGNMEGKEVRFGIAPSSSFSDRHDRRGQRRRCDARQLHAAGRHGPDPQHAVGRNHLRRRRLRAIRHVGFRRRDDVRRRADGRAHARISRQEAGGARGQDDAPGAAQLFAVDPGVDGARGRNAAGHRRHRQFRSARFLRDPVRLRFDDRHQRQFVRRPFDQHSLLQPDLGGGDVDGALRLRDPTIGGRRFAGAEKARPTVGWLGPDAQPAIRGAVGRRRADHGRPHLLSGSVARTRRRAGGDESQHSLSGALTDHFVF